MMSLLTRLLSNVQERRSAAAGAKIGGGGIGSSGEKRGEGGRSSRAYTETFNGVDGDEISTQK